MPFKSLFCFSGDVSLGLTILGNFEFSRGFIDFIGFSRFLFFS